MKYKDYVKLKKEYEKETERLKERSELKTSLEYLKRDIDDYLASNLKVPDTIAIQLNYTSDNYQSFLLHPYSAKAFLDLLKRYSNIIDSDLQKIDEEIQSEL